MEKKRVYSNFWQIVHILKTVPNFRMFWSPINSHFKFRHQCACVDCISEVGNITNNKNISLFVIRFCILLLTTKQCCQQQLKIWRLLAEAALCTSLHTQSFNILLFPSTGNLNINTNPLICFHASQTNIKRPGVPRKISAHSHTDSSIPCPSCLCLPLATV